MFSSTAVAEGHPRAGDNFRLTLLHACVLYAVNAFLACSNLWLHLLDFVYTENALLQVSAHVLSISICLLHVKVTLGSRDAATQNQLKALHDW